MNMKSAGQMVWAFILVAGLVSGCAKKADTTKSVDQIRSEVQKMSVGDLESSARAYANEIISKKSEIEKITKQVQTLSPAEILGEKAKGLRDQLSTVSGEISKLTERYQIYAQKFQEQGGDISRIQIS